MAREGIYVGGKEVLQRYVGTRLVWEKVTIQFDEILRFTSNRFGSFWRFGSTERAFIDLGISEAPYHPHSPCDEASAVHLVSVAEIPCNTVRYAPKQANERFES